MTGMRSPPSGLVDSIKMQPITTLRDMRVPPYLVVNCVD